MTATSTTLRGPVTMQHLAGERRRYQISQTSLAEALGMTRARLATRETSNAYVMPTDHFADEWMKAGLPDD